MSKNALIDLGHYDGVAISARDDGYVNATQMCKACGKLWGNYWQLQQTQEFAAALSLDIGIPISKLATTIRGRGDSVDQGTWVHRKLAIHLANWLSPQFAVWCINRLDELFQTGVTAVNREHAEHALVIAAVDRIAEKIITPMAASILGIQGDVADVKGDVAEAKERLIRVEVAVAGSRKPVSTDTRIRHVAFVSGKPYDGNCPCCESRIIVVNDEFVGQIDHWYGRQHRQIHKTWPVCTPCNLRLATDTEYKQAAEPMFLCYQRRRESGDQPLLGGLDR